MEFSTRFGIVALHHTTDAPTADTASMYHITEHNAGLIIRRLESSYCFETLELSPTNRAAMTTRGRLAVAEMQPKVKKAQQMHNEERDTTDPCIVTELLTSFLRGAGTPAEIKAVQKRMREEVSWNNSSHPWTRSPLWLLLRVGLQLTMMALQAGPFDEDGITIHAHARPTEVEFGLQILKYLSQSVSRVQENWESYTSLCSFTCLATRLLAQADKSLLTYILKLILKCREICYKWVMYLLSKAQDIEHRQQRKEFLEAAVHIALVCIETFNWEGEHFERALAEEQQAEILLEISIIVQNNADFQQQQGNTLYDIMLDRYKVTMHKVLTILSNEITINGSSCLDLAIKRRWPDFAREGKWSIVSVRQLLVDGSPVSRLPQKYETHREYQKLFGSATMELMPSNLPGMSFYATKKFHTYTVHLGMQTKKGVDDLLVRLSKTGSTLDLIPSRSLQDLLPDGLSENHVHWLEEASGEIEFCHVNNP
ncbi:hypothetical protein FANTH_2546 [Fusarium anthophilum]|uniref:DUF6606 domain-containing protein n=1 Tax=Fusarium anthophilum TaxID=48485 RepID=A0A8H5EAG3_9HYPO|nr:hypothetical protein FANTH_2546 [Fusarium anthophilum]